ncbi:MAG: hypothetical protein GIKADHBN_02668 [Phycisphaerales bacterium]|nr:hypothetical protein [Phycisphaerales bacterium]
MQSHSWSRCLILAVLSAGVFFGLGQALTTMAPSMGVESPSNRQVVFKGLMVLAALVIWVISRRPWRDMGWGRPAWTGGWWRANWPWYAASGAAMAAASLVMILTRNIHPLVAKLSFLQLVLGVWVVSSVAEEIYVRGMFQGLCSTPQPPDSLPHSQPGSGPESTPASRIESSPAVVTSAALFASMHLPLIWMGSGVVGGSVIVAATLVVGWACAVLRARTGSVWPPILLHFAANVAAVPGGIIGTIAYRLINGEFPKMP